MYFWTWDTQEVLYMILWMRKFNQSGKGKIQFLGFDMQTAAVAAENARKFLAELDPGFAKEAAEAYDGLDKAIRQAQSGTASQKSLTASAANRLANVAKKGKVDAVLKHMEEARSQYLEKKPVAVVDWAIQNARVAAQAAGPLVHSSQEGSGHRDRCMADNVDWILAQAPPGSKLVLWAHNGHVSKSGMRSTSMGTHLAKRHGKDYVVLGFAAHQGRYTAMSVGKGLGTHMAAASQPGSIEYYVHASGLPRLIIDLRRAAKDDPASAWLTRTLNHRSIGALAYDGSYPAILPEEYDALIAFDDTTPSQCFRIAPANAPRPAGDARRDSGR
jgi:erythromycin esterase